MRALSRVALSGTGGTLRLAEGCDGFSRRADWRIALPTQVCVHLSHESGFRVFCDLS